MKKAFVTLAVSAFSLMSCKKEYTCECTSTDSSGTFPTQTTTSTIKAKKKDAKTSCENGSSTNGTVSVVCTIK